MKRKAWNHDQRRRLHLLQLEVNSLPYRQHPHRASVELDKISEAARRIRAEYQGVGRDAWWAAWNERVRMLRNKLRSHVCALRFRRIVAANKAAREARLAA